MALAIGSMVALICVASSRVGARTRPIGRPGLRKCLASRSASRATSGMANAMVLPEPVRPRPRTSRPDRVSGRVLTWIGKGSTIPCAVRVSASALGVPRAANVVMCFKVFQAVSMRISAPDAGWLKGSPKKSQVINRAVAKLQQAAAGTKWNAFIDAGCASHMKKSHCLRADSRRNPAGIRLMDRSRSTKSKVGITAHQVPLAYHPAGPGPVSVTAGPAPSPPCWGLGTAACGTTGRMHERMC